MTKRAAFYDLPHIELAQKHVDGWAWMEHHGGAGALAARYDLRGRSTGGADPSRIVAYHAPVSKLLQRLGPPPLLVAILLSRYPRIEGAVADGQEEQAGLHHRRSFEAIELPAIVRFQALLGATDRQIAILLEEREKAFLRQLSSQVIHGRVRIRREPGP